MVIITETKIELGNGNQWNVTEQCIVTNANFLSHDKIEFAKQGMKLILPACRFKHLFPFKLESMRASKNAARINNWRSKGREWDNSRFMCTWWFIVLIDIQIVQFWEWRLSTTLNESSVQRWLEILNFAVNACG